MRQRGPGRAPEGEPSGTRDRSIAVEQDFGVRGDADPEAGRGPATQGRGRCRLSKKRSSGPQGRQGSPTPMIVAMAKQTASSHADQESRREGARAGNATYDRVAPFYDLLDAPYEYGWRRPLRRQVFARIGGRILDAGAGTGANIPFYPSSAEMHAIDASPRMLQRAAARAAREGREVDFRAADLCDTPFPARYFDAVVSTFVFCVLQDGQQLPALRELARICRPGGQIRLIDYRLSRHRAAAALMTAIGRRWSGWLFDCNYQPTTENHLTAAGLAVIEDRFLGGDIVKLLT